MNLLVISDIHGIKKNLSIIEEKMNTFQCDKLIVLGDLYYIGPRNKMQEDYDISYVKDFLERFQDKLICLRGNCDSDVDIEASNFPIINDLGILLTNGMELYLTHGHIYNETNWKKENSILLFGHYHIPFIKEIGNNIFINPGSISLPKNNFKASYLVLKENEFTIYDIEDNVIEQRKISK